jgi:hypothetical protein
MVYAGDRTVAPVTYLLNNVGDVAALDASIRYATVLFTGVIQKLHPSDFRKNTKPTHVLSGHLFFKRGVLR